MRRDLISAFKKNREKAAATAYNEMLAGQAEHSSRTNPLDHIVDVREHDLPHHVRTSIDKELFVGSWCTVNCR